jgi:uncharacterized membrane protein YphA (DoxX/SURF4 family)
MANMPSIETARYTFFFGVGFIIIAVLMFMAVYNAHTIDAEWITHYFGGLVCSIIFGILGVTFAGSGLYFLDRKVNQTKLDT